MHVTSFLFVQASVFKPADRIDASAFLSPGLARMEVQGYAWTDTGFQIAPLLCMRVLI